jgi:hypothetical protein
MPRRDPLDQSEQQARERAREYLGQQLANKRELRRIFGAALERTPLYQHGERINLKDKAQRAADDTEMLQYLIDLVDADEVAERDALRSEGGYRYGQQNR